MIHYNPAWVDLLQWAALAANSMGIIILAVGNRR